MARLKLPGMYELDVGSSEWGWHKMADLVVCVNNLLDRSTIAGHMTAAEIGHRFVNLNKEALFAWSDDHNIDFVEGDKVNWQNPNLFVPAGWGSLVVKEVKKLIAQDARQKTGGIAPVDHLKTRQYHNSKFSFVQPATLTGQELEKLLSYFQGEPLKAMRRILVENRNEPCLEQKVFPTDSMLIWCNWRVISCILDSIGHSALGGKRFRLISNRAHHLRKYQLWEIR